MGREFEGEGLDVVGEGSRIECEQRRAWSLGKVRAAIVVL